MLYMGFGATFLTTDEIVPFRLVAVAVAQVGELAHGLLALSRALGCEAKDFSVEGVANPWEVGLDVEDSSSRLKVVEAAGGLSGPSRRSEVLGRGIGIDQVQMLSRSIWKWPGRNHIRAVLLSIIPFEWVSTFG